MSRFVASMRVLMMVLIVVGLVATLTDTSGLVPDDYSLLLTYYTLQANVASLVVWGALTWHSARRTRPPTWLEYGRAYVAANLVLVAGIYWTTIYPLGTEDGAQMVWVMIISHIATPVFAACDQLFVGPERALPWRRWWLVAGYAPVWTVFALVRGADGGWVPYDYLESSRGYLSILTTLSLHFAVLVALSLIAMRARAWRTIPHPGLQEFRREPRRVDARVPATQRIGG